MASSIDEANILRNKLKQDFADDIRLGKMNVYDMITRPIGPHPYGMFECDFKSQEMFAKLVPLYVCSSIL